MYKTNDFRATSRISIKSTSTYPTHHQKKEPKIKKKQKNPVLHCTFKPQISVFHDPCQIYCIELEELPKVP